jgi:hypothetical protein
MTNALTRYLLGLPLVAVTAVAQAITLSVNPAIQNVNLGSSVSVGVSISGLADGAAPSLGAYDFDLSFNPGVLSFSGAVFGDQLDLLGSGSVKDATPGAGSVRVSEISLALPGDLDSLQAGSFTLATLSFQAIGVGASLLDLTINGLEDAVGAGLTGLSSGGMVTVQQANAIPEPSTLLLACLAMLALAKVRFRARMPRVGTRPG